MSEIVSRPYSADPKMVCERCVFGNGDHADWCESDAAYFIQQHQKTNEYTNRILGNEAHAA